jgi:quinoprotein glucose dehydrogenase
MNSKIGHQGFIRMVFALVLGLLGVDLLVQGGVLVSLGGSVYYSIAGSMLMLSALLLFRRRVEGLWVYSALLLATIVWSIWEAGLSGWSLLPRLDGPVLLGLLLCLPRWRRNLTRPQIRSPTAYAFLFQPLGLMLLFAVAVGLGIMVHDQRKPVLDPAYQQGVAIAIPRPAMPADSATSDSGDWGYVGHDLAATRFSPLQQISPATVSALRVEWTYRTGPSPQGEKGSLEVTPLKIDDSVYLCTSVDEIVSLDAETGRERWRFDPHVDYLDSPRGACRGVAYYRVRDAVGDCAQRIISATIDAQLIAVDARTGRPCAGFGEHGRTSLLEGMGAVPKGFYYVSSAPAIVRGRIIVGGWVADGQYWGEPSGVIRGYDAVTGRFSWSFDVGHLDRQGMPAAGESYTRSTPNSWGPMSGDEALGLVFAPMGNSVPDYYGAQRRVFDDQFSSGVLAIEAETGRLRWSFQTTHHDLWDYDVASQPTLIDLPDGNGGSTPALIQATKRAEVFLLDRRTGKSLTTVEELPAPQRGSAPGERLAATQPFSTGMPSFRGPDIQESDMWGISPLDQLWCRIKFKRARYDGPLTPPGLSDYIQYPGYIGGMNWWGVSVNPDLSVMIVNVNRVGNYNHLVARADANRMGVHPLANGGQGEVGGLVAQWGTPFAAAIGPFMSPLAVPCQAPPYGTINAVDLRSHKLLWSQPLGTAAGNGPLGISSGLPFLMGTPNLGGSFSTRSGLTFIAATPDRYLRAFETMSGRILWSDRLPAGGHSTPMSYRSPAGRQMIVIAASGAAPFGSKVGDYVIAYALPK